MNPAITHRHVIVRLLNGPIYQEDLDLWGRLELNGNGLRIIFLRWALRWLAMILRAMRSFDNPKKRMRLLKSGRILKLLHCQESCVVRATFHQTIFMVILREELMRFEQEQEEGDHLYRSALDLREVMLPYYPENA